MVEGQETDARPIARADKDAEQLPRKAEREKGFVVLRLRRAEYWRERRRTASAAACVHCTCIIISRIVFSDRTRSCSVFSYSARADDDDDIDFRPLFISRRAYECTIRVGRAAAATPLRCNSVAVHDTVIILYCLEHNFYPASIRYV